MGIHAARWWTVTERAATTEVLTPRALAGVVAQVLAGHVPDEVTQLGWGAFVGPRQRRR